MQHCALESWPAVASVALVMWIILPAPIASVKGAGTRTGEIQSVVALRIILLASMWIRKPTHVPLLIYFGELKLFFRPGGGKVRPTLPFSSNVQVLFHLSTFADRITITACAGGLPSGKRPAGHGEDTSHPGQCRHGQPERDQLGGDNQLWDYQPERNRLEPVANLEPGWIKRQLWKPRRSRRAASHLKQLHQHLQSLCHFSGEGGCWQAASSL